MTRPWLAVALAGAVALAWLGPGAAGAGDLRGRVDTKNAYSGAIRPMANGEVQLVSQGRVVMRTLTGLDGFYYFQNAAPGKYQIVVNRQLRVSVTVEPRSFQDIAPILFAPR